MGNHEFCSRCHASDFHSGRTCEQAYPEGLAKAEKERADHENQRLRKNQAVEAMVKRLRRLQIPAEVDEHVFIGDKGPTFKVVIEGHDLIGSRRKAMLDTDPKVQARRLRAYERKYGDGW